MGPVVKPYSELDVPDGLTYRQLDRWWSHGVFDPLGVTPGMRHPTSGYRRDWSIVEGVLELCAYTVQEFRAVGAEPGVETMRTVIARHAANQPCWPLVTWAESR